MISVIIPSREPVEHTLVMPGIEFLNMHGGQFVENCRKGFRESKGEYILYLNDDAYIRPEGIRALAKYLDDHPDVAIVGPHLSPGPSYGNEPTLLNALCDFLRLPLVFTNLARAQYGNLKEHDVDYVSGACLMVRGGFADFSPAFTAFYEDVDLCRRIRDYGFRVVYLPTVRVYHVGGASYVGEQKSRLMHDGLVTYLNRWHSPVYAAITVWLYEHRLFSSRCCLD